MISKLTLHRKDDDIPPASGKPTGSQKRFTPEYPARVSLSTPRWRERGDREGEIDSWLPSFAELVKTVKNKLNLTN